MFPIILTILIIISTLTFNFEKPKWRMISILNLIAVFLCSQQLVYVGMDIADSLPTQISQIQLNYYWLALIIYTLSYILYRVFVLLKNYKIKYKP
jgi:uncharacterized membrane protein